MKEIICQVCSNRCPLKVWEDGEAILVNGHRCHRGEQYGREEYLGQRQVVRYRVATTFPDVPSVPVRTSDPVPKEFVFKLVRHLKKMKLSERFPNGAVIESNPIGLEVNLLIDSDELDTKG